MALDPYYQLGVERDADDATIKRAYRRKAQETHPDRNPDDPHAKTRFQLVQEAWEILSDPNRRAAYDRDGTTKKPNGPDRAMAVLVGALMKVLEQAGQEGFLQNPRFMLIESLNEALDQMKSAATTSKREAEGVIAALEAQIKRVKYKGNGQNVIADVLDEQLKRTRAKHATHVRDVTDVSGAIELMKQYEGLPPEDLFTATAEVRRFLSAPRTGSADATFTWA